MKLKCLPEDFIVEEMSARVPTDGRFALYELRKQSIGTLEALKVVGRTRNLAASQISHGGMKDRHACTTQLITIRNGPRADIQQQGFTLSYLGQTDKAFSAADIDGNRFTIVLRSLSTKQADLLASRHSAVARFGFPNYFDRQRFGSLGASNEFMAAEWCRKNYERAIWLVLADPNRHDNAAEREQKKLLRDLWGNWTECKKQLSRSHRRSIVTYLVDHPTGFRKAFALIDPDLRGLGLSAFQSAVWNRMLATVIGDDAKHSVAVADCELPFPDQAFADDLLTALPLPSARCRGLPEEIWQICDEVLAHYDLNLREMKLSFPRDRWFARGQRPTVCRPGDLSVEFASDDLYDGRQKATLKFELPRGIFATMLIKSLLMEDSSAMEAADGP